MMPRRLIPFAIPSHEYAGLLAGGPRTRYSALGRLRYATCVAGAAHRLYICAAGDDDDNATADGVCVSRRRAEVNNGKVLRHAFIDTRRSLCKRMASFLRATERHLHKQSEFIDT